MAVIDPSGTGRPLFRSGIAGSEATARAGGSNPYRAALHLLRRPLLAAGGFSALISLLMLTGSLYMLQVYDRVLASGSLPTLQGLFVIVIVAYAFYGFYEFLRARILSRAGMRLEHEVAPEAFCAALRSAQGVSPAARAQPMRDLETLRGFLSGPAVGGLFDLPWIPVYLVILAAIHPYLGMLTLAGAGIAVVVAWLNYLLTRTAAERAMTEEMTARAFAEQSQRQAEMLEAMGMAPAVRARWRQLQEGALGAGQAGSDISEGTAAFSKAFRMFLQSAMLTLGAWLVLGQEMSGGMIIATSILSGRVLAPIDQIIGQWRAILRAQGAHRRLQGFFDAEEARPAKIRLPAPTGRVEARNLSRFAPATAPGAERRRLLSQVSFVLEPGECLGVIGDSAAGKSTLARLLVGAWSPDLGEVRLDDAPRAQWDAQDLGRHLGYLPQSVEMLPGTVRDNIARFRPEATDAEVIAAARAAGVHEMILALPDGYATLLGGVLQPLSGGQMQRLGLARALFGDPRIVVLDEPNSNLDSRGDAALLAAIEGLKARGATVIVMTHRTAILPAVDKLMVLSNGMIARFGRRDEILQPAPSSALGAEAQPAPLAGASAEAIAPPARALPPRAVPAAPAPMAAPAAAPARSRGRSGILGLSSAPRTVAVEGPVVPPVRRTLRNGEAEAEDEALATGTGPGGATLFRLLQSRRETLRGRLS